MAIYISKNAIKNIPDELTSDYLPGNSRTLRSNHFKHISFFNNLANQAQGADVLKKEDKNENVTVLQSAINAGSNKLGINNETLTLNGVFGDKTENALKNIQQHFGLVQSGILDSETLLLLDIELAENLTYDTRTGIVYNKGKEKGVLIVNKNGAAIYDRPQNDSVKLETLRQGEIIDIAATNNDDYFAVETNNAVLNKNLNNNAIGFIKRNEVLVVSDIEQPEPGAELVQVQPGETLISIIYREYYKDAYGILKDPNITNPDDPKNDKTNPDNLIYTFPQRELKKDTRLRFLVNLLFYMNHNNSVANKVDFQAPYEKYTLDHLDNEYIYDNTGYKLNYQFFLEKLKGQNPNYEWEFVNRQYTVDNKTFTFDAPVNNLEGDYIWIPSRAYVEGLYYSLNFCPQDGRMYTKKTIPGSITPDNPEGESFFDWIDQTGFLSFLDDVEQNLREVVQYAEDTIQDVIKTYKEARELFITAYNWLDSVGEKVWPRAFGTKFEGGFSLSAPVYGIPLTLKPQIDVYSWREMTSRDRFVIKFREKSVIEAGLEVGVGQGYSLGRKTKRTKNVGSGKAKEETTEFFYGLGANATAAVTGNVEVISIYEFDVSKEGTPFLAMTVAMLDNFFGSAIENTKLLSNNSVTGIAKQQIFKLIEYYFSANIDPNDYIIHQEAAVYVKGRIYADAYIGNVGKAGEWQQENIDNKDKLKPNKLFSLLRHLNMGGDANAEIQLGGKYTYQAEYKNIPNAYTQNLRLPSKVSIENELFASSKASLNINFNEKIVRWILGGLNTISPISIIPSFNLDTGIAFFYNIEYTRKKISEEQTYDDHYIDESQLYSINDPNNVIVKTLGFKLESGDLDNPLGIGSEKTFWLEFAKLKEYMLLVKNQGGTLVDYVTNLDILLSFFHKVTIRQRLQPTDGITNRNSRRIKKIVESSRSKANRIYKKQFKDAGNGIVAKTLDEKIKKLFEVGLDVEASLEMKEVLGVIKFVYGYLRFAVSKIRYTGDELIGYQEVETKVASLIDKVKKDIVLNTSADLNTISTGSLATIFETSLVQLESYYHETASFNTDNLQPYIELVGDFVKLIDAEGLIDSTRTLSNNIRKALSPYLIEIREVLYQVIIYLLSKSNIHMIMEGRLSFGTGGEVDLGAGLKVEMGFFGAGGLYGNFPILREGKIAPVFTADDPYFKMIGQMIGIFGKLTPVGLQQSFLLGEYLIANSKS